MIPRLPPGFSHPMSIGEGSFGSVYRVRQHLLDRWVALKIICEKDLQQRTGFLKEAKVQAQIDAECVPQIFDAFEWKQSVCIVMQWIKGISLTNVLKTECSVEEKLTIATGLIHSLAQLHSLGFAHRDIKPANILIDPHDGIFLVDFGFTKNVTDAVRSTTSHAQGTPAYMAPEIWIYGGDVDLMRADVYSVGIVLQQILIGCDAVSFTERLIHRDPSERPQSAKDIEKQWLSSQWSVTSAINWKLLVEKSYTHELSEKMFIAAQRLIAVKRYDEAYELLIESLEENPDNNEAIDLMSKFATIVRRKSIPVVISYGTVFTVVVLAVIASYFAGIYSGKRETGIDSNQDEIKVFLKVEESQNSTGVLPFRNNQDESGDLNGVIIIDKSKCMQSEGILYIDTIPYNDINEYKSIDVKGGSHVVIWKDNNGTVLYRETVKLLPFQTKRVILPSPRKGL